MKFLNKRIFSITILLFLAIFNTVLANDVKILAANFKNTANGQWSVDVTLKHNDIGWDHYADNWRVVDASGNILGDRVLFHPHENEQPFTRSLSNVPIPDDTRLIFIEAHDKVHGWTPNRMAIDLSNAINGHLQQKAINSQ